MGYGSRAPKDGFGGRNRPPPTGGGDGIERFIGEDASSSDARSAIGMFLYDRSGNPVGTLTTGSRGTLWVQLPSDVGLHGRRVPFSGGVFSTGAGELIDINERGMIVSARDIPASRFFGDGGGGGGVVAFSSTREAAELEHQQAIERLNEEHRLNLEYLQEQERLARERGDHERAEDFANAIKLEDERHQNALDILGREQTFAREQNALSRENQLRLGAIQELGSLRRSVLEARQQAHQFLTELQGRDPLRAAIATRGGILAGPTPGMAFNESLRGLLREPLPGANVNPVTAPLPDLFGAVSGGQQQTQVPQQPAFAAPRTTMGFAGGGTVFALQPDNPLPDTAGDVGVGIKVGELGEELMHLKDGMIEVIPIVGRGQGGFSVRMGRTPLGTRGLVAPTRAFAAPTPIRPAVELPTGPGPGLPSPAFATAVAPTTTAVTAAVPSFPGRTPTTTGLATTATPVITGAPTPAFAAPPSTLPSTASNTEWANALLANWAAVDTNDANIALQRAQAARQAGDAAMAGFLERIADIINRVDAGFLGRDAGAQQVRDILAQFPTVPGGVPGGAPPLPVPDVPVIDQREVADLLADLLGRWPFVSQNEIANLRQRGFRAVADLLFQMQSQLVSPDVVRAAIEDLLRRMTQAFPEDTSATIRQAIELLYRHLGIATPLGSEFDYRFNSPAFAGAPPGGIGGLFQSLGIAPALYRNAQTGQVFVVQGNQLIAITEPGGQNAYEQLIALGIDPGQVITLEPAELQGLGKSFQQEFALSPQQQGFIAGLLQRGPQSWTPTDALLATRAGLDLVGLLILGVVTRQHSGDFAVGQLQLLTNQQRFQVFGAEAAKTALPQVGTGAFPLQRTPIIEPNTGLPLPDPRTVVQLLNRMQETDPNTYNLLLSAYELAGYPIGNVGAMQAFFSPQGSFRPSQVAAFG